MNDQEALLVIDVFCTSYPRVDWPEGTIKMWARLIADLDFEKTQAAVVHWCSTEKWPPQSVAEIRERVIALAVDPTPEADEAWQEVIAAVRTLGSWSEPTWSNPLIGEAVNTLRGSWQELCANLLEDELVAERAHFLKIYAAKRQTHQRHLQAVEPSHREHLKPAARPIRPMPRAAPETWPLLEGAERIGRPIPE